MTPRTLLTCWRYLFASLLVSANAHACPDIDGLLDWNCDGKLIITAFGDSITRGVGDSTKLGYPGRLKALLPNLRIVNLGDPGENTTAGRQRAAQELPRRDDSDYIVILEGVNDYFTIERSAFTTRDNLLDMVEEAKDTGAITVLARLTQIRRDFQRSWVLSVNTLIRPYSKVDFYSLGEKIIGPDRIHPNGSGYKKMASYLRSTLIKLSSSMRPADSDGDGIYDFAETKFGTNSRDSDSDNDNISDGAEVFTYKSNPLSTDSDGDGLSDNYEVNTLGSNPASALPGSPTITSIQVLPN